MQLVAGLHSNFQGSLGCGQLSGFGGYYQSSGMTKVLGSCSIVAERANVVGVKDEYRTGTAGSGLEDNKVLSSAARKIFAAASLLSPKYSEAQAAVLDWDDVFLLVERAQKTKTISGAVLPVALESQFLSVFRQKNGYIATSYFEKVFSMKQSDVEYVLDGSVKFRKSMIVAPGGKSVYVLASRFGFIKDFFSALRHYNSLKF